MAKVTINGMDLEFDGTLKVNGVEIEATVRVPEGIHTGKVFEVHSNGPGNGKTYVVIQNKYGQKALLNTDTLTLAGKCLHLPLCNGDTIDDIALQPEKLVAVSDDVYVDFD